MINDDKTKHKCSTELEALTPEITVLLVQKMLSSLIKNIPASFYYI